MERSVATLWRLENIWSVAIPTAISASKLPASRNVTPGPHRLNRPEPAALPHCPNGWIPESPSAVAMKALAPSEAQHYAQRGNLYDAFLRIGEARVAYMRALERDPNHKLARENLNLCGKILLDAAGRSGLRRESLLELESLMRSQGRLNDLWLVSRELAR